MTLPAAQLEELASRVEKAEGGSRELDALIFCAADSNYKLVGSFMITYDDGKKRWRGFKVAPAVSSIIDEALELVEKMLPEWELDLKFPVSQDSDANAELSLYVDDVLSEMAVGIAPTPALALIAALLKALASRAPNPQGGKGQ
jgi:hypothetical protein